MSRRRGAKWAGAPAGAIASSVADMELAPSADVLEAARAAVLQDPGYSSTEELARPVEAGLAWAATRHGLELDPGRAAPVDSVAASAAWVVVRRTAPGDGVVRVAPTYPPLVDLVADTGRRDLPVALLGDGGRWELDLEALDAACADAELLVWVGPHNPTGRVWTTEELTAVAECAARHGLDVLADEVWADIVRPGHRHVPFASVAAEVDAGLARRTTTFLGTSKTWNLAGVGAGLVHAGGAELWRSLRGTGHVPMLPTPHRASLAAATAAWSGGAPWLERALTTIGASLAALDAPLRAAFGDRVTAPEGTYLVWLDLRGLVPDDDPAAVLAVPDGVVPSDGVAYGAPGFVRLNAATTPDRAAEVARRVVALVHAAAG